MNVSSLGWIQTIRNAVLGTDNTPSHDELDHVDIVVDEDNRAPLDAPKHISPEESAAACESAREAAHDAAYAEGYAAEVERCKTVLTSPTIKGDAKRMHAAFDLLQLAPDMAADAVIFAVEKIVPRSAFGAQSSYEEQRLADLDAVGWMTPRN